MGMYRWYKDWDRGWQLQEVDPFEGLDGTFYLPDNTTDEYKEELVRDHTKLVPWTQELQDDLNAFHFNKDDNG